LALPVNTDLSVVAIVVDGAAVTNAFAAFANVAANAVVVDAEKKLTQRFQIT
jgi:hypothetical protein